MSDTEIRLLRLGWNEQDEAQRAAIWGKVKAIVRDTGRADLLEAARSSIATWVNDREMATASEFGVFLTNRGSGMHLGEVRGEAIPPIMDSVAAIVAEDGLEAEERDFLCEPLSRIQPRAERE